MPAHLEPDPHVPESITTLVPPYWTDKKGIAHAFKISTRTVDVWRSKGWVPCFKVAGTVRFSLEAVKVSLEQRFAVAERPISANKAAAARAAAVQARKSRQREAA
jgi:hypothetical protein